VASCNSQSVEEFELLKYRILMGGGVCHVGCGNIDQM
jgi:hypothetical protein